MDTRSAQSRFPCTDWIEGEIMQKWVQYKLDKKSVLPFFLAMATQTTFSEYFALSLKTIYSGMFRKTSTRQNSLVFRATRPVLSGSPTCPSGLGQISRWVVQIMMMVMIVKMEKAMNTTMMIWMKTLLKVMTMKMHWWWLGGRHPRLFVIENIWRWCWWCYWRWG